MANPTTNFGWQMPTSTDLVTDLPADFEVFGQAVDTALVDLKGGTTGQVLSKASNTDMDFTWITNDVGDITAVTAGTGLSGGGTSGAVTLSIDTATTVDLTTAQTLTNKTLTSPVLTTPSISNIDAKGDLLAGTADNTIGRLAVGTNGQVLTADSAETTGMKWATPGGSAFSGVHLSKSASQSCANNATTTITFDTEQYDTDSYHSTVTNTSRITVATAGYYAVYGELILANNTNGVRQAWIAKNGSNFTMLGYNGVAGTSYAPSTLSGSDILYLAASDYIEIQVSQSSGGALNALPDGDFGGSTACRFTLQKLGA